jgi:hypothetical protein
MNAIVNFVVYGVLSVVALHILALCVLIVAAPSQIYREQKNKIKSLLPPPLNLALNVGDSGVTERRISLEAVTITNQSQRNMNLTFCMIVNYIRGDGTSEHTKIEGAWHGEHTSSQDGIRILSIKGDSTETGALVFAFPQQQQMRRAVSLDEDCVLEIKDAVSKAIVGCKPAHGYPSGKVTLP